MVAKRKRAQEAEQKARWEGMTEEATVDCYNEYEEFSGILARLEDRLELPFQSKVLGETVEVIGLDEEQSSERRGVVAKWAWGSGRARQLDVRAITTVAGNVSVEKCTKNVLRVLTLMDLKEYPLVAEGAAKPLVKDPFTTGSVHGEDGLGELGDAYYGTLSTDAVSPQSAVDLMLRLIADHPGEITLIATGPLTNVARAIKQDPTP